MKIHISSFDPKLDVAIMRIIAGLPDRHLEEQGGEKLTF